MAFLGHCHLIAILAVGVLYASACLAHGQQTSQSLMRWRIADLLRRSALVTLACLESILTTLKEGELQQPRSQPIAPMTTPKTFTGLDLEAELIEGSKHKAACHSAWSGNRRSRSV